MLLRTFRERLALLIDRLRTLDGQFADAEAAAAADQDPGITPAEQAELLRRLDWLEHQLDTDRAGAEPDRAADVLTEPDPLLAGGPGGFMSFLTRL